MNLIGCGWEWNDQYEADSWCNGSISTWWNENSNYVKRLEDNYTTFYIPERSEIYVQLMMKFDWCWQSQIEVANILRIGYPNTTLATISFSLYQTLTLWQGDKVTSLFETNSIRDNKWWVIELHAKIHATTGILTLRLDGEELYTFNGDTTISGVNTIDRILLRGIQYYTYHRVDNLVVNDTLGDYNNSWPGATRIRLIRPSAAGSSAQWSRSTGVTNYTLVDDVTPSNDADYVYAPSGSMVDLYAMANPVAETDTIYWISVDYWMKGCSLNINDITPLIKIGATTYEGAVLHVPYSLEIVKQLWEVSPATSAAWTVDELTNLEFGMRSEA